MVYTGVYYVNCKGLEERELKRKIYEKNTRPQIGFVCCRYVIIIERFVVVTTVAELSYHGIYYLS